MTIQNKIKKTNKILVIGVTFCMIGTVDSNDNCFYVMFVKFK